MPQRPKGGLHARLRVACGRAPVPPAGVIDAQSVKAADTVGSTNHGYDAAHSGIDPAMKSKTGDRTRGCARNPVSHNYVTRADLWRSCRPSVYPVRRRIVFPASDRLPFVGYHRPSGPFGPQVCGTIGTVGPSPNSSPDNVVNPPACAVLSLGIVPVKPSSSAP